MILLCGIPSETPLRMVADRLDEMGIPFCWFNQRRAREYWLEWELVGGTVQGELRLGTSRHRLEDVRAAYVRLMDDRLLPELDGLAANSPERLRCRALHEALCNWYEVAHARVVNRAQPQASNASKPYQAQLILKHGFEVPETLITNDPELVRDFHRQHGQVVFKSMSGIRSIVRCMTDDDLDRLENVRWCPVQFQAFVPGTDVRVHVVGAQAFATAVHSDVTDYRYAHKMNGTVSLEAIDLPDDVMERCVRLAADLGLAFAGVDLKMTPDGRLFCFEVNPSPAYSYFEANTGQPIARAVARYLAGLAR